MLAQVWLIGGTSDSAKIAELLTQEEIPLAITVTTDSARSLYPSTSQVIVAKLSSTQMIEFCQDHLIRMIVDASHPFATEVSHQAIAVAQQLNIPYLRYERASYQPIEQSDNSIYLASFDQLLTGDYLDQHRVLLTIGCQALAKFSDWQERATLFARILPRPSSLSMAIAAGFKESQLIALRPPISLDLEIALWQHWQISLVVTKASGSSGGEAIKHQAAANLDIPLIAIKRPLLHYPQQTALLEDIVTFCRKYL